MPEAWGFVLPPHFAHANGDWNLRIPSEEEMPMSKGPKPTHTQPGGFEDPERADDEVVNDSLGTVDTADSTGTDEDLETGDAKDNNQDTRED